MLVMLMHSLRRNSLYFKIANCLQQLLLFTYLNYMFVHNDNVMRLHRISVLVKSRKTLNTRASNFAAPNFWKSKRADIRQVD